MNKNVWARTRNNKKSPTRFISCRVSIHEISISNGRIFGGRGVYFCGQKKSVKYPATEFSKKRNLIKLIKKQSDKNQRIDENT